MKSGIDWTKVAISIGSMVVLMVLQNTIPVVGKATVKTADTSCIEVLLDGITLSGKKK